MKTLSHLASLQPFIPRLLPPRTVSYLWEEVWHPLKMQLPSDPWPNFLLHTRFSTQWFWFNFSLRTVAIKSHFHHRTCCLPSWPSLICSVRLLSLIAGNLTDFRLQARLSSIWIHHHLTHISVRPNTAVLRTPASASRCSVPSFVVLTLSYLPHFEPPDIRCWPEDLGESSKNNKKERVNLIIWSSSPRSALSLHGGNLFDLNLGGWLFQSCAGKIKLTDSEKLFSLLGIFLCINFLLSPDEDIFFYLFFIQDIWKWF